MVELGIRHELNRACMGQCGCVHAAVYVFIAYMLLSTLHKTTVLRSVGLYTRRQCTTAKLYGIASVYGPQNYTNYTAVIVARPCRRVYSSGFIQLCLQIACMCTAGRYSVRHNDKDLGGAVLRRF